jgi:multidrug resistance efflux pump
MPRAFAKKQSQVKTKLSPLNVADRIPSLSRSEVSGTDNEATTPDASHGQFEHVEVPVQEYSTHDYTTHEFPDEYDATSASVTPPTESRNHSPVKEGTPSAQRFMDVPNTAIRSAATPFAGHTAPLNDVTSTYRNREAYREATPSPQKMPATPASEYATPRPLASAADRRKSHLLTVLQSSKLPSKFKAKGTPHSVRRVSLAPDVASLAEEGNSTLDASFVSIASSQDLTLDRRASRLHARGNTSVPNIVLGTGMAESPSGPEVRIEFAKISKHTNMMNDALNEENAALAAELKIWQDEVKWMTDALSVKGIEITDDGEVVVPAQAQEDVPTASPKKAACDHDDYDQITAERDEAVERHAELEEELRNHVKTFEDIGDDFKQQIEKLEADLEAAKADANRLESEASRRREGAPTKDIDAHLQEIAKLEEELAYAQEEAQAADAAADKARKELADLQFEHEDVTEQLQHAKEDVEQLREQLDDVHHDDDERVARLKAQVAELEEEKKSTLSALSTAKGHIEDLQDELAAQEAKVRAQQATIVDLETKDDELVKVDKALRIETERKVSDARDALADRDAEIASLQAALDVARMTGDRTLGESSAVAALQERLDDAHHEIEQLRKERAAAADSEFALKSRDARITALENEKEMLVERLRARTPGAGMGGTPMRSMRSSTPLVNRILAGLHSPKTPGTPLRDMSWLQTTTDSQESLLRARLEVLQDELEAANVQLDKNFGRLEQAGVSSVGNAEQLVRARQRIDELEAQLRDLARKNKQSLASLGLRESRIEHRNERLETALDAVKAEMESMRVDHAAQCDHLANEARRLRVAFHDLDNKYQEEIEELGEQIVAMRREEDDKIRDAEDKADALASENEALNSVSYLQLEL